MASPSGRLPATPRNSPPSVRTTQRPLQRASHSRIGRADVPAAPDDSGRLAQAVASATSRGFRLTWRMAALVGVLVILLFSYAGSLRVYFNQQSQIAAAKAQIQANQQAIGDMKDQLQRWQDPAYVEAQARARLGWVMPGETGFQVIGEDGQPIGGASITPSQNSPAYGDSNTWWGRLMGSVAAADDPAPVASNPGSQPPITVDTTPAPSDSSSPR